MVGDLLRSWIKACIFHALIAMCCTNLLTFLLLPLPHTICVYKKLVIKFITVLLSHNNCWDIHIYAFNFKNYSCKNFFMTNRKYLSERRNSISKGFGFASNGIRVLYVIKINNKKRIFCFAWYSENTPFCRAFSDL